METGQTLAEDEIEAFLEFLFSDVARKPKPLKSRLTADVALYLEALALEMPKGDKRKFIDDLSRVIRRALFVYGQVALAEEREVIQFLKEHSKTYLNAFDIEEAIELVESLDHPANLSGRRPNLMARGRSVQGPDKALFQDDLTERIYVAYCGLRQARTKNTRNKIADILKRLGFKTRAEDQTDQAWGPSEVIERVRQFEDHLVQQHRLADRPDRRKQIQRRRDTLVRHWIQEFRTMRHWEATRSNR